MHNHGMTLEFAFRPLDKWAPH